MLPPSAQKVVTIAENANAYKQQTIAALPLSDSQKSALTSTVDSLQAQAVQHVQQTPVGAAVVSLIQPPSDVVSPPPQQTTEGPVHIAINAEDVAAVQAFLNSKKTV